MEKPLISVIIPAYNVENYIRRCLSSVTAQTCSCLEIIAVDDGSTDRTAELLDAYAREDTRIRVIHKENGGVTSARLRGVREAAGEWIAFADGDDTVEPDLYELLLTNAQTYHAEISHCGYQMVFPDRTDPYYGTGRLAEQDHIAGLKDLLEGKFVEPGLWNKLFHRPLFQKLLQEDLMDPEIRINEDLLMNFYLFRESEKSVFHDVCKYNYMVRSGSAATARLNTHKLLDPIRVTKLLLKETEREPELQDILQRRLAEQLIALATMSAAADRELIAANRRTARKELRGLLPELLHSPETGGKLKAKALWAGTLPTSYGLAHSAYLKVTGLDRKYEVHGK